MKRNHRQLWPAGSTFVLLIALAQVAPARAQTVEGTVVDDESSSPMETVEVLLLDASERVVEEYVTDARGNFLVQVPDGDPYRLRARRLGYEPSTSDVFVLAPGQAALAELRLQVDPVLLDPILVEGRNMALSVAGFYEREMDGYGQVRTPEDLEAKPPQDIEDLLRGMSGIRIVRPRGTFTIDVLSTRRVRDCRPSVTIDNRVVQRGGAAESTRWHERFNVREVAALEVYAGQGGLPDIVAGPVSPCGAIIIWTKGYIGA